MRQYAGFGTAKESNARYHQLVAAGTMGLSVAFDLPTQMGYDSDEPIARGEVGKVGVAIDSIEDMRVLFDGIPLDKVSTSMTINAPAARSCCCSTSSSAEEQGVPADRAHRDHPERHPQGVHRPRDLHLPAEAVAAADHRHLRVLPRARCRSGTRSPSPATTWPRPAPRPRRRSRSRWPTPRSTSGPRIAAGLDVDDFAPRLSFFFVARTTLLEEVAKFRAARRIWARLMRDEFGAKNPKSMMLRFHTQTAGVQLTAQQPEVNLVRVAVQGLAAVLGGTQSLHTNSFDEAIALPTEKAARLALRTQQVLAYETDLTDTVDPFAGSYVVEAMTDEIEAATVALMQRVDDHGAAVGRHRAGFQKAEIEQSAYRIAQEIDSGERVVVGLNRFTIDEEEPYEPLRVDPAIEAQQAEQLARLRAERDADAVDGARRAAGRRRAENVLYPMKEALRARATVGEVARRCARCGGRTFS